ncbi:snapalysin family zinc-dependent metalloprotease [Streptomyces sp. NPDC059718]
MDNVTFVPVAPGRVADVTIVAFDGRPYAEQEEPGRGTVHIGRRAVDEGYDPTRIATHEPCHILGLDDKKPGPCSSLMSGSTAGTSCRSLQPDEAERSTVERLLAARPPVAEAA